MSQELTPQEQAYLEGFAAKCAEYGVDPEALMKHAGIAGSFKNTGRKAVAGLTRLLQRGGTAAVDATSAGIKGLEGAGSAVSGGAKNLANKAKGAVAEGAGAVGRGVQAGKDKVKEVATKANPFTEVNQGIEKGRKLTRLGLLQNRKLQSSVEQLAKASGKSAEEILASVQQLSQASGQSAEAILAQLTGLKGGIAGLGGQIADVGSVLGKDIAGVGGLVGAGQTKQDTVNKWLLGLGGTSTALGGGALAHSVLSDKQSQAAYSQGFIDKCAEYGVDPEALMKASGIVEEGLGYANPLNLVAGIPAAVVAALTKTRSAGDQLEADKELWPNLLIPGRSAYNTYKRIGSRKNVANAVQEAIRRG